MYEVYSIVANRDGSANNEILQGDFESLEQAQDCAKRTNADEIRLYDTDCSYSTFEF